MFTSTNGASHTNTRNTLDKFLVCGLKSLGQHCVAVLKEYDVNVIAIDSEQPEHWEVPEIPNILEKLIIGDCRQPSILEAANIHQCRSVILVTRNERMNIEAAFAARRLNPDIRLIVRSDKQNLNELLGENLGNFFAFEPTQLSAYAFALTALSSETIGYFNLEGRLFQVIQHQVKRDSQWCYRSILHTLNNQTRRILSHTRFSATLPKQFHDWEPETIVKAGDTLIYIDIVQQLETSKEVYVKKSRRLRGVKKFLCSITLQNLKHKIITFWQSYYQNQSQIRQVATIYLFTVIFLWLGGIILYTLYFPDITIQEALLQELKQPIVGVNSTNIDQRILPQMPLIVGNSAEALTKANVARAKSVILVGDDNMENLEVGLMAHAINPNSKLVIRSHDSQFSDNIAPLFPYAQVLCGAALSAEVFACAAFGEKVLSIFHFNNQIVMVTEYNIETGDTLEGLLIAELAYGYGVVPILHQNLQNNSSLMPNYETRLDVGDRLIVLATSDALQRIEWGEMLPRLLQVHIEQALTRNAIIDGTGIIASITGCNISTAKDIMNHLPATLPTLLYQHQAQYLVRELSKVKVLSSLINIKQTATKN
ncbi:hypothetical protein RIVM261_047940 [Rivularia sp. IAM M-261]|nr:hypothetical protein RIVM261_047940 [Rivularia sp. IAM M-261]